MAKDQDQGGEMLGPSTVMLDRSKIRRIGEIAHSNQRSLSAELRFLIDRRIAEYDDASEEQAA
jgi:hypothetical protein